MSTWMIARGPDIFREGSIDGVQEESRQAHPVTNAGDQQIDRRDVLFGLSDLFLHAFDVLANLRMPGRFQKAAVSVSKKSRTTIHSSLPNACRWYSAFCPPTAGYSGLSSTYKAA